MSKQTAPAMPQAKLPERPEVELPYVTPEEAEVQLEELAAYAQRYQAWRQAQAYRQQQQALVEQHEQALGR